VSRLRQFGLWLVLAVIAILALLLGVSLQSKRMARRLATQAAPQPARGDVLFRQKGCVACHGTHASDVRQIPSASSLPRLVSTMWNHAPRMWEAMRSRGISYPSLDYEEAGQLVSYLYFSGHSDPEGNPEHGRDLFVEKRCAACHAIGKDGHKGGPDLSQLSPPETPIEWAQGLWNHAADMQTRMAAQRISWPTFQPGEVRDLLAYVRQQGQPKAAGDPAIGDPSRGWQVFQDKGCTRCHEPSAQPEHIAPAFGAGKLLPPTYSEFGQAMLNHFPQMQQALTSQGSLAPKFASHEMLDLAVFLYSLNYQEPTGSPLVGASVFQWRGCAACHGAEAEGTVSVPPLRGRGVTFTATRLAADLWRHGVRMQEQNRALGQPWPSLQERDIGDLLSFLNTPLESSH